ncbi:MAG: ArsR family transcriptional regulator [Solirubrobacteraceae bacterium]
MIRIELTVEDLANTRFAISPLIETVFSLWALSDPSRHTLQLPWLRAIRGHLSREEDGLLRSLVGRSRIPPDFRGNPSRALPDFLTPRPASFHVRFEDELAAVRFTPPEIVRRDLVATHAPDQVPDELRAATRPGDRATIRLLGKICDVLEHHWERSLAPSWPEMQLVLEADTTYRARQLATGGARLLFADMHPNLRWSDGVLTITEMVSDHTVAAAGRGLLLLPSIFAFKPAAPLDPGEPPSLGYPSRGVATLWSPPPQAQPGALVDLLGRTRALLLQMLEEPLATNEVARRLKVTPSAVSQHLQVLHAAGLVTRARDRRQVLYRRSPTGDRLAGRG